MRAAVVILILGTSQIATAQSGYFQDRERGWWWYEQKQVEEERQEEKKIDEKPKTPREVLKAQGEEWENSLSTAVLDPTKDNVTRYLASTQKIQEQASKFSEEFKKAIWVNPEYDYTLVSPVTTQAIIARNETQVKNDSSRMKNIADRYGLIFFFRSDCPHCHRFAPIVQRLSSDYGITVIPVSLDGGGLPEFPYPKRNMEIGEKMKVSVVPAIFMINPGTNTVATVGYGYSDYSELMAKIIASDDAVMKGGQK